MSKSVVLLSGGLDSTVSLAHGLIASEVELFLTFDYVQRSAAQEKKAAAALAHTTVLNTVSSNCLFLGK